MKNISILFFILTFAMMGSFTTSQAQNKKKSDKALRHVVLFKFKNTSHPDDIRKIENAFVALKSKISLIKDFEWGTNNSPENLNQDLTHCFVATFFTEKDRDAYLVHPEHQAFVKILKPHMDKVTVIDYWTK